MELSSSKIKKFLIFQGIEPLKFFLYFRKWDFLALYFEKWNFPALILKDFLYFLKRKLFLHFEKWNLLARKKVNKTFLNF